MTYGSLFWRALLRYRRDKCEIQCRNIFVMPEVLSHISLRYFRIYVHTLRRPQRQLFHLTKTKKNSSHE